MRPGTFIEAKAWPVAPRPFPEEAMGSWIGRVAARYRVSVEQLCGDGGIELDTSGDLGWLMPVQLPSEQLRRLARLARLDPRRLSTIEAPSSWRRDRIWAFYCATCVFLNQTNVTGPRWKRAWLDPGAARCDVHDMQLETIPVRSVRSARSFEHLLRMVSRLEEKRRQHRRLYLH
jgi:TniQ